jgi:DNA-binding NarL/FixJ family response regulator
VANAKGDPLKRIRILLAGMPTLMLNILQHVITSQPDMVIVGVVKDDDLLAAARRTRAEVVIVGLRAKEEADDYTPLLFRRPRLKVLAIADTGKSGSICELRLRRVSLGQISVRTLANAIRGGASGSSFTRSARRKSLEVN